MQKTSGMDCDEKMETGPGWWYRPIVIRDPKTMKDPVLACRTQGNSNYCKANDETRTEASGENITDDGGKVNLDEMTGKDDKRANVCVEDNLTFPCGKCSKVFLSKRGLGGHVKAHYPSTKNGQPRMPIHRNDDIRRAASVEKMSGEDDNGSKFIVDEMMGKEEDFMQDMTEKNDKTTNVCVGDVAFPCGKCSRVFSSNRSLGSHLKAHYLKIIDPAPDVNSQNATDEFGIVNGSHVDQNDQEK